MIKKRLNCSYTKTSLMVKRGDFKLPFGTIYRQLSYLRNSLTPVPTG